MHVTQLDYSLDSLEVSKNNGISALEIFLEFLARQLVSAVSN